MRRVLSLLLTAAMVLSLLVVAGADQQTVTLKTAKSVNGNEVTYTFTLDATGTKGVGALSFDVKTTNLTFKANSDVYNEVLDTTFRPGVAGVQDGSYGFHTETNRFVAYGGDGAKDGTRLLKDSVQLVSLTYTIDDAANYSLEVTEFKACYSGAEAMTTNKYNCVIAPVTDGGSSTTGVTVSGTALSWNDTDDAVYLLYPAATTDDAIKAEWKSGTYTGTACTEKGAIAASGKQYGQSFTFGNVAAGDYKLAILKPGKYVPKIVAITVGTEDLALGEMKLWLYGDVNYDGKVNKASDVLNINRYIAGYSSIFDQGDEQTKKDRLAAANVTAITGSDTTINKAGDVLNINRYIAGYSSVFDRAR